MGDLHKARHEAEAWATEVLSEVYDSFADTWVSESPRSLMNEIGMIDYKAEDLYEEVGSDTKENFENSVIEYVELFDGSSDYALVKDVLMSASNKMKVSGQPENHNQIVEGITEAVLE